MTRKKKCCQGSGRKRSFCVCAFFEKRNASACLRECVRVAFRPLLACTRPDGRAACSEVNHHCEPPTPSPLAPLNSSTSPRSGPTPLRWPEGRPAPLRGLLPCLQSARAATAPGLLQCDNLCLLRYALPRWIHLVTTWHSLLGIPVLFFSQQKGWGERWEGLFSDCQRETRLLPPPPPPAPSLCPAHTHPSPAFISPPPTSAECFNLSEDPGISAAVVAEVGFFTLAGPVWEKGPAWYLKTEGLFAVRQIETQGG